MISDVQIDGQSTGPVMYALLAVVLVEDSDASKFYGNLQAITMPITP